MKVGSLFSGIGGLDLGLERSGHEIVWQAENDKAACAILARHWPSLENFGDVTEVDWSTVDRPDAICAGNPCPDFSQAGQRKGMAGEHGQLWFEVTRALRTLRPRVVILENVPGIYTSPGLALDSGESALGVVLSDLASLGYVGSYASIRASDFGACHRRERWFAIAHATSEGRRQESGGAPEHEAEQNGGTPEANYVFGSASQGRFRTAAPAHTLGLAGPSPGERYSRSGAGTLERPRRHEGQMVDGVAGRTGFTTDTDEERRRLGRVEEPTGVESTRGTITDGRHQVAPDALSNGLEGQRWAEQEALGEAELGPAEWGLYWPAIAHWEDIFGRRAPRPTDAGRLRPELVEWMMGFDEGWTEGVAKTHRLRCLGNAVFVPIAEHLGRLL